jgi:peptide/nickel transport system ATP-binding protein
MDSLERVDATVSGIEPLAEIHDLSVRFVSREATVHAVNGVSFTVNPGEVLCILGESGSGKSVTLRALMRLLPPGRTRIEGSVRVCGEDVLALPDWRLRDLRGGLVSMIFQEPMTALDPVYTIGQQIGEAVRRHTGAGRKEARARALELLEMVRIPSPERRLNAYPHELSGGLRQRAMIAMALSCRPRLLLADEPTTALDATVQVQVLILLRRLQRELGMGMIFVTHDLGVAAEIADRVAVMYAGRIVESGPVADILRAPAHPYTAGLLASTVHGQARDRDIEAIPGSPPDMRRLSPGCAFAPRCVRRMPACREIVPLPRHPAPGRMAACLAVDDALPVAAETRPSPVASGMPGPDRDVAVPINRDA